MWTILTGSSNAKILEVNAALSARFSLKDLQPLTTFLGVEICYTSAGLLLSQRKYITDLLQKFNMFEAKGVKLAASTSLNAQKIKNNIVNQLVLYSLFLLLGQIFVFL